MHITISNKRDKTFDEIWRESMRAASDSFSIGDIQSIMDKYGVDRTEAEFLDALYGNIENQLKLLADRGKTVLFVIQNIKTHAVELYSVRDMEDWRALMDATEVEYPDGDRLENIYYAVRAGEKTRGVCTVAIMLM